MDRGKRVGWLAVASGGDAVPILKPTEKPFDAVPAAVVAFVKRVKRSARSRGGNDGLDPSVSGPAAQTIGVIGFVGDEVAGRRGDAQQWNGHVCIGNVAGRQGEAHQ